MFEHFTSRINGVGFESFGSGEKYHLDLFAHARSTHLLIAAMSGAGKTVLASEFIIDCLSRKIPIAIPLATDPPGQYASYHYLVKFLASLECNVHHGRDTSGLGNLIAIPSYSTLSDAHKRLELALLLHQEAIRFLVMGDSLLAPDITATTIKLINSSYRAFHSDPIIASRYKAKDNQNIPTLIDYLAFISDWFAKSCSEGLKGECQRMIVGQLQKKLNSSLRSLIASPGHNPPAAALFLLSFERDDVHDFEIARYFNALSIALSFCLSFPKSVLVLDGECNIPYSESLNRLLCLLCTKGEELGLSIILTLQDVYGLIKTESGVELCDCFSTKFLGKTTIPELFAADEIGFPESVTRKAMHRHRNSYSELHTYWHLNLNERCSDFYYRPKPLLLALMTSTTSALMARHRVMERYSKAPLLGLQTFAGAYIAAKAQDLVYDQIA